MAEAVVEQLDLMRYYGTEPKAAALGALRGEVSFYTTQYKSMSATVESKDLKMAAATANTYLTTVDRVTGDTL